MEDFIGVLLMFIFIALVIITGMFITGRRSSMERSQRKQVVSYFDRRYNLYISRGYSEEEAWIFAKSDYIAYKSDNET